MGDRFEIDLNALPGIVKSLGLRRIRHTVELKDSAEIRGMIHKVRHLVTVE